MPSARPSGPIGPDSLPPAAVLVPDLDFDLAGLKAVMGGLARDAHRLLKATVEGPAPERHAEALDLLRRITLFRRAIAPRRLAVIDRWAGRLREQVEAVLGVSGPLPSDG
jgi:hypothetical protein